MLNSISQMCNDLNYVNKTVRIFTSCKVKQSFYLIIQLNKKNRIKVISIKS